MPGLKSARPVLGPLLTWSKAVIDESRRLGHEDTEAAGWISAYARDSGWTNYQIYTALSFNGIKRKNPCMIVCPRCDNVGRINVFNRNRDKLPHIVIVHGKQDGFWGTKDNGKIRRRTRCFFYSLTAEQRRRINDQMIEKQYLRKPFIDISKVQVI